MKKVYLITIPVPNSNQPKLVVTEDLECIINEYKTFMVQEIDFLEKKVRNLENRIWQLEDEYQQVQYDNMELSGQMEQFQDCCNNKSEIIEMLKDKYTYVRNYLDRLDSDSSND